MARRIPKEQLPLWSESFAFTVQPFRSPPAAVTLRTNYEVSSLAPADGSEAILMLQAAGRYLVEGAPLEELEAADFLDLVPLVFTPPEEIRPNTVVKSEQPRREPKSASEPRPSPVRQPERPKLPKSEQRYHDVLADLSLDPKIRTLLLSGLPTLMYTFFARQYIAQPLGTDLGGKLYFSLKNQVELAAPDQQKFAIIILFQDTRVTKISAPSLAGYIGPHLLPRLIVNGLMIVAEQRSAFDKPTDAQKNAHKAAVPKDAPLTRINHDSWANGHLPLIWRLDQEVASPIQEMPWGDELARATVSARQRSGLPAAPLTSESLYGTPLDLLERILPFFSMQIEKDDVSYDFKECGPGVDIDGNPGVWFSIDIQDGGADLVTTREYIVTSEEIIRFIREIFKQNGSCSFRVPPHAAVIAPSPAYRKERRKIPF